ncbi:MAG: 4'-phosphopantetheinyl transferase superfamily protein, partial [Desulfobacteraceae bacterium]|nr:4'-phosphopantetheinyl transferase superfamily protein [Desulfobacteraceae bacterium]
MTHFIKNKIKSIPLQNEPEIKLWYCEIPSILTILFDTVKHPYYTENYNIVRNRTIDKHDFLITFLSDLELTTLNNFKSFKKQIEWLAGRFLLKNCLSLFIENIDEFKNILVAYEEEGAPFLPDFPDIKISLSHSGNIAAVGMCSKQNIDIGVDVEQFRSKPDKNFLNTAFTQNEINSMDDTVEDILIKWTTKEAFLKYIKKGFNESLHKVEV